MKKYYFISALLMISALLFGCGKKNQTTADTQNSGPEKIETVEFKCEGMTCTGCEQTITKGVNKLEGIKDIVADYKAKYVKVTFAGNITNKDVIRKAINEAGYDTEDSKSSNPHQGDKDKVDENKHYTQ
jgi:copper chaperone CopZ